jgi:hypothetical protein
MVRQYLFDQALDQLLKARRYKEVVGETNVKAKVGELIARFEQIKDRLPDDANLRTYMKRQVCIDGAKYYEALLGSGNPTGAAEVVAMLAAFDATNAFPESIAAARRAGDAQTAKTLAEEASKTAKPLAKPEPPKAK